MEPIDYNAVTEAGPLTGKRGKILGQKIRSENLMRMKFRHEWKSIIPPLFFLRSSPDSFDCTVFHFGKLLTAISFTFFNLGTIEFG